MKKILLGVSLALIAAGCGVKAQTYVMTRERSDIEPVGNGGYIAGKGQVAQPDRKTRKVYVFEFTKVIPESEVKKIEQETSTQTSEHVDTPNVAESATPSAQISQQFNEPVTVMDEEVSQQEGSEGPQTAEEYVIQKDDTLQKIAKKYYNSYGKWVKIYEANKDKIKNPNLLKAGTKITIPAVN